MFPPIEDHPVGQFIMFYLSDSTSKRAFWNSGVELHSHVAMLFQRRAYWPHVEDGWDTTLQLRWCYDLISRQFRIEFSGNYSWKWWSRNLERITQNHTTFGIIVIHRRNSFVATAHDETAEKICAAGICLHSAVLQVPPYSSSVICTNTRCHFFLLSPNVIREQHSVQSVLVWYQCNT